MSIGVRRSRRTYALIEVSVALLGLLSRTAVVSSRLPSALRKSPGDVLYALMVYVVVVLIWPRIAPLKAAILTFAVSALVEILKLIPQLAPARNSRIGGLVLGHAFDSADFLCYAIGAAIPLAAELCWARIRCPVEDAAGNP